MSDPIKPTKLTQLLQPEQSKPAEVRESPEATKYRREECMAKLAANPRFKIRTGTGTGFIIGMPMLAAKD
jgi:hypothetical protein